MRWPIAGACVDEADRAHLVEERHRAQAVAAALAQRPTAYAGADGVCRRCGEPIEAPRLRLLPQTPYCAACAQENEQRARRFAPWTR